MQIHIQPDVNAVQGFFVTIFIFTLATLIYHGITIQKRTIKPEILNNVVSKNKYQLPRFSKYIFLFSCFLLLINMYILHVPGPCGLLSNVYVINTVNRTGHDTNNTSLIVDSKNSSESAVNSIACWDHLSHILLLNEYNYQKVDHGVDILCIFGALLHIHSQGIKGHVLTFVIFVIQLCVLWGGSNASTGVFITTPIIYALLGITYFIFTWCKHRPKNWTKPTKLKVYEKSSDMMKFTISDSDQQNALDYVDIVQDSYHKILITNCFVCILACSWFISMEVIHGSKLAVHASEITALIVHYIHHSIIITIIICWCYLLNLECSILENYYVH